MSVRDLLRRSTGWKRVWAEDRVRKSVTRTRWPLWVRNLRGLPGVYLVRRAGEKTVLYVGRSEKCVKDALLRHFRAWGDDQRGPHRRVLFDRRVTEAKVYVFREASLVRETEAALIRKHDPPENVRRERAALEPGSCDGPAPEFWEEDDLDGVPF